MDRIASIGRTVTTVFTNIVFEAANQDTPDVKVVRLAEVGRSSGTIDEADLHAYVDALLKAGRRAAVEAALARDPDALSATTAYRALNVELHRLFDRDLPPLTEPLEALTRELDRRLASCRALPSLLHGALALRGAWLRS